MARPIDIAHLRSDNVLQITWDDGLSSTFPMAYLRAWCPCAGCQGHGTEVKRLALAKSIGLAGIYEIGAYAVALRFTDGHDTGIFTWEWLTRLRPENAPAGLKQGVFSGGEFRPG